MTTSWPAGSTFGPATWAKAEERLTTAATMYREMDMGFYLTQAEAALKEPGPRAGR